MLKSPHWLQIYSSNIIHLSDTCCTPVIPIYCKCISNLLVSHLFQNCWICLVILICKRDYSVGIGLLISCLYYSCTLLDCVENFLENTTCVCVCIDYFVVPLNLYRVVLCSLLNYCVSSPQHLFSIPSSFTQILLFLLNVVETIEHYRSLQLYYKIHF